MTQISPDRRARIPATVDLTVVIPTHNRSAKLAMTLDRLTVQTVTTGWDVVVVANNCTDGTVALIDQRAADFPVRLSVIGELTPGAAAARNAGAAVAEGADLLFLDDDILVEADCLERVGRDRRDYPGVWLTGQVFPLPEHATSPFGAFRMASMPPAPTEDPITEIRWFASGIALIPKQALLDLGGYEQAFTTAALEDADLAIRAHRAGHSLAFDPGLTSHHNDWAGTSIRDFCDRARRYCATAPQLERSFGRGDHPWSDLIDSNRPPIWKRDPSPLAARKLVKALASRDRSLRVLLDVAEYVERVAPARLFWPIYRAAIAGSMYAGYQDGIADHAIVDGATPPDDGGQSRPRLEALDACPICQRRRFAPKLILPDQLHGVPGAYRYVRCLDCHSVFQNPRVLQEDLSLCYPESYFTHVSQTPEPIRPTGTPADRLRWEILRLADGGPHAAAPERALVLAARLLKQFPSMRKRARFGLVDPLGLDEVGRRCLEVGPGRGYDMIHLSRLGWDVEGLEADPTAAEVARTQSGRPVADGTLESNPWAPQTFDLVYGSHVVEHFLDPARELGEAWKLLRLGGRLVLIYPNPGSLVARVYGRWAPTWDPPRHIAVPSPGGISALLKRIGFDEVTVVPLPRAAVTWAANAQQHKRCGGRIEGSQSKRRLLAGAIGLLERAAPSSFLLGEELLVVATRNH
jgi:GT2 family glycosyltransferase/SAM-dependent methyltransferase